MSVLRRQRTVGDTRGIGMMAGVEIVADRASRAPYPRGERMAQRIQAKAVRRGKSFTRRAGRWTATAICESDPRPLSRASRSTRRSARSPTPSWPSREPDGSARER